MESLGTVFTVVGFLGFLVSLIALIVALVKKKRKKPWILSFVAFFVLAIIGGGILPSTESDVETKKFPEITKQEKPIGAEPEELFGLLEEKRKEIWKELILIERRAMKEAEKQYPLEQSLSVGQIFTLSKETPLMPELEPADPMAAIEKVQRLPPLVTIKILKVVMKQQTPWYFIEATSPSKLSLGSGWINSVALIGQVDLKEQLQKQVELENRLINKYKDELRKKYGLTAEQLEKISSEGLEKNWPFPRKSE